jgi:hypothetical protein
MDDGGGGSQPGLGELDGIEHQTVVEAVQEGRAVDDPRLAGAALEHATQVRRSMAGLGAAMVAGSIAIFVGGDLLAGGGVRLGPAGIGLLVGGSFAGTFVLPAVNDAGRAERRNRALRDRAARRTVGREVGAESDGEGRPTILERIGWLLLGLLVASLVARVVGLAFWAALNVIDVDPDRVPTGVTAPVGVVVLLGLWAAMYRGLRDRDR